METYATSEGRLAPEIVVPLKRPTMDSHDHGAGVSTCARILLVSRFPRHPERNVQIMRILRTHQMQQVAVEFGLTHEYEEEFDEGPILAERDGHGGADLVSAQKPCCRMGPRWR